MTPQVGCVKKGGRKAVNADTQLVAALKTVIECHTAGSPVKPNQLWTNRSSQTIANELGELGFPVCANSVAALLRNELKLSRRQIEKKLPMGESRDREAQFDRLIELRGEFLAAGRAVLSIDTKKKELLGLFHRRGRARTNGRVTAWDHDFPSSSWGKVIPYGVYDVGRNEAFMMLASGSDTGELVADSLRRWWHRLGKWNYDPSQPILLLADCGGSNGYRVRLFRERLSWLAEKLGLTFRVGHLPPYCSKYNPIDHRLFCHISRSLKGMLLKTVETIRSAIERTTTAPGLRVLTEIARKVYQPKIKPTATFLASEPVERDEHLPQLNYVISPSYL